MVSRILNYTHLFYIILLCFPLTLSSQVRISEIIFEGNNSFSSSEILEIMKSEEDMIFKTYICNSDRISIQNFYTSKGFIDAEVSFKEESNLEDFSEKRVTFIIRENFKHHFGEIAIRGNSAIEFERIWNLFEGKMGEVFEPKFLTEWQSKIVRMYNENGKPSVNVKITTSVDTRQNFQVNLFVEIEENQTFYIGDIIFVSLKEDSLITQKNIIRNELEFSTGDIYKISDFEDSYKFLYKTNLFQTVELRLSPRNSNLKINIDTVDVYVRLEEKKRNYIGASTGVTYNLGGSGAEIFGLGEDDWLFNLETEFGKRNIWDGSGAEIRIEANPEFLYIKEDGRFAIDKIDLSFQLSKINFPLHRVKSTGSFNFIQFKNPIEANDKFDQIRYSFQSLYEFSERENINFRFNYDENSGSGNIDQFGLTETNIYSFFNSYSLDKRNHYVTPSSGYTFGASFKISRSTPKEETALEQKSDYLTAKLKFSKYIQLKKNQKYIFAWNLNAAAIFAKDTITSIPKTERLYITGLMRGFLLTELGKFIKSDISNDISVGGKYLFTSNFELRYNVYNDWFGQLFVDVGSIWTEKKDISFSSLRYSYGGGISWNLDYLVIRAEYGFKLNREKIIFVNDDTNNERESSGKFHLGASYFF